MTATEIIVDTGTYASNGNGHSDAFLGEEELTFIECAADDCHNMAYQAAPGSGKRSSKFCRQADCTKNTKRSRQDEEDPFSSPLTAAEKRLARQLELPLRLAGMGVYRANVIDGLIIGHSATPLAEALVLEGRVSKPVRQMCEAVAKFAGAGPIALVLIDMGLQIASNHKVPLLGDVKPVDANVKAEAQRIQDMRKNRANAPAATITQEVQESTKLASPTMVCPTCGRTVLTATDGMDTLCMCGAVLHP